METMSFHALFLACAATILVAWAATWAVRRGLERQGIFDTPNPRSSHAAPVPRGGGLALVPVISGAWIAAAAWAGPTPHGLGLALGGAAMLAGISWIDDRRGLPVVPRLATQAGAVALGIAGLDGAGLVFQGLLPPILDRIGAGLLWLWFVNLFNFMDGIDGISAVEAVSVGLGLALVGALAGWPVATLAPPAIFAAAAAGFLPWNWSPAKVFLGDVGSVPLGYLLGWMLLTAASEGQWAAALLLPLYYLADATITLMRHIAGGRLFWTAHRDHFYQRAVQGRASHRAVSLYVLACNGVLVLCAAATAFGHVAPGLFGGAVAVVVLLSLLAWRGENTSDKAE